METVDGRNPAPVDVVNITLFTGVYTSQVVQDFSHQQLHQRQGPKNWDKKPPIILPFCQCLLERNEGLFLNPKSQSVTPILEKKSPVWKKGTLPETDMAPENKPS